MKFIEISVTTCVFAFKSYKNRFRLRLRPRGKFTTFPQTP